MDIIPFEITVLHEICHILRKTYISDHEEFPLEDTPKKFSYYDNEIE